MEFLEDFANGEVGGGHITILVPRLAAQLRCCGEGDGLGAWKEGVEGAGIIPAGSFKLYEVGFFHRGLAPNNVIAGYNGAGG
jgi:hypothetical protein